MNTRTLILRSFAFHWRSHLGTLLASAVGTAVLVGALLVGDSVRHSLRTMALERLGEIDFTLVSGDRFFKADLDRRLGQKLNSPAQSILLIEGVAINQEADARANQVQLTGVQDGFWKLGKHGAAQPLQPGEAVINQRLAEKVNAKVGGALLLRIYKPGMLPHDAPLGSDEKHSVALRVMVKEILPDRGLGRFSLNANQVAPYNLFVPLADLQQKLEQPGRANVLLVPNMQTSPEAALKAVWTPDDAQLRVRTEQALGFVEITTPRVFLDETLTAQFIGAQRADGCSGVATYFVNAIRANGKEIPYSMVTAGEPPLGGSEALNDDEVVLNEWAAEDLQAKSGDKVELEYFTVGHLRKLKTNTARFTVKKIVPLTGLHADRELMPDFPGIKDVDTTHDWDSSIPIDMKKIRPKDEDYWKKHRGTPKAFIALSRGTTLWQNRFGTYTALRFPAGDDAKAAKAKVEAALREKIDPARVGLQFIPIKQLALAASAQAIDFSGLFIGFSFFLILSAILLMVLLFQFSIESRASENGILLALGFTPRQLRRVLCAEGTLVAAVGSALGVFGGAYYARYLLESLSTRWRSAVNTSALEYHAEPQSFAIGLAAGVILAGLAIYWGLRRQARRTARELLAAKGMELSGTKPQTTRWRIVAAVTILTGTGILLSTMGASSVSAAGAFFGAGGLFLLGFIAVARLLLAEKPTAASAMLSPSLGSLGIRATSRRVGRSLATVALLASGSFLIVAVGANRQDENATAHEKTSGTGGFALTANATIPLLEDLNTPSGRANAGVPDDAVAGATIFPFRVKAGDEASCLNLNRAQRPRIVGVPKSLLERGGFTFAATYGQSHGTNDWHRLIQPLKSGAIPAIADFQSLTWALGLKVGDTISVPDERGTVREIQFVGAVANSILQGNVLIAEDDFIRLYPSESGYRMFLIDAAPERAGELAKSLATALQDEGFDVIPAAQRLAEFNAVQNTYLATFAALGGLGLLLGSLGLGVVVLRNVLERRSELAVLRALGFSRGALSWLIFSEHGWLLLLGMTSGVLAAGVAVIPSLQTTGSPPPWGTIGGTLLAVLLSGGISALLTTWFTVRGPLLSALRND